MGHLLTATHTHTLLHFHTQIRAILAPTIESCDPQDLCNINSDNVQAAGGSLSQEPDHRLKNLGVEEGWREVVLYTVS